MLFVGEVLRSFFEPHASRSPLREPAAAEAVSPDAAELRRGGSKMQGP